MTEFVEIVWEGAVAGRFDATALAGLWTIDDGERIQLDVLERRMAAGDALAGWKVGLTSGAGRDSFGPGVRPFGYILKSHVFQSGDRVELSRIVRPGLETELCFRVGTRAHGPKVGAEEVRGALAGVAPAFEINEDRIDGPQDPGIRVADDLRQWGLVRGTELSPVPEAFVWDDLNSSISVDGKELERVAARGHIDDHFESIAALTRELAKFDRGLEVDDLVITGSFTRQAIDRPGTYAGTFAGIGDVTVTFT